MTILICAVLVSTNVSGINFVNKTQIEGTLVSENESKYYVDFKTSLAQGQSLWEAASGTKILVDKQECVKK